MKAQVVPYSSVVGQSVLLTDRKTGEAIGQLGIMSHDYSKDHPEGAQELAQRVADAINKETELHKAVEDLTKLISRNAGSGLLTRETLVASDRVLQLIGGH